MGCTCRTKCDASTLEDFARCDFCYTENGCGRRGLRGTWDFCVYPVNKEYEAQSSEEKLNSLWKKVEENQSSSSYPNVLKLLGMSVQTSFDTEWDIMPEGREKVIHSVGATCKFKLKVVQDSPYSGLFSANELSSGLIRLGGAQPVTVSSGVVPGVGIKFLRSKVKSANFVALFSLDPLPNKNYDFFSHNLTNKIPPATGFTVVLAKKFEQASQCPYHVGLSDVCAYNSKGEKASKNVFPYEVKFYSPKVRMPNEPRTTTDMQKLLTQIKPGTELYRVYAFASPKDKRANKSTFLGSVVTDGPCVNSKFGDERLFFRHQRIEEDWSLRPDWIPDINPKDCGLDRITTQPPKACPKL